MKESILKNKSYSFALTIVELFKRLSKEKKEFVLSNQLLKSGTSIGANIREAEFAQSTKGFINKMSIALKEANETDYWLTLIKDSGFIENSQYQELYNSNLELIKMLVSTINTTKAKL